MRRLKHDDSKITEVKAVLDRLQRISPRPNAGGARAARDGTALPCPPPQPAELASRGDGSIRRPTEMTSFVRRTNAPPYLTAVIVVLVAAFAGTAVFVGIDRQSASIAEPPPDAISQGHDSESAPADGAQESTTAALKAASEFIASGQVQAARAVLLRARPGESADVAWALARSHDPNFLVTVQASDAAADVAEATRWYRMWYGLAVRQGMVADSISLERIIRSMN
jgi:hypothetical protein